MVICIRHHTCAIFKVIQFRLNTNQVFDYNRLSNRLLFLFPCYRILNCLNISKTWSWFLQLTASYNTSLVILRLQTFLILDNALLQNPIKCYPILATRFMRFRDKSRSGNVNWVILTMNFISYSKLFLQIWIQLFCDSLFWNVLLKIGCWKTVCYELLFQQTKKPTVNFYFLVY